MTKCSIRNTATVPDDMCKEDVCPMYPPVDDRGFKGGLSPFLAHIIDLKLLVDCGAHFMVNDLLPVEWDGLKRIRIEKNIRDKQAADKEKQNNLYRATHGRRA